MLGHVMMAVRDDMFGSQHAKRRILLLPREQRIGGRT